jgi:hypothetical protein
MSRIYNKHIDQSVRTIDSVKPTTGFQKTKEFKKNLKIKELEKQLGKKPTTQKLNKGGRVGLKGGSFPDFSGDGKTTMKDILMGRGVIPKPKPKNKKKIAKKFKTPMEKAIKKNKKLKIAKNVGIGTAGAIGGAAVYGKAKRAFKDKDKK